MRRTGRRNRAKYNGRKNCVCAMPTYRREHGTRQNSAGQTRQRLNSMSRGGILDSMSFGEIVEGQLMSTAAKPYYTEAEYLARERRAEHKSEYNRGEIFAMAGATREHNLIVVNVASELRNQLKNRDCEVYPSDMRVRLPSGLYTYPDVTVACGEPKFIDDEFDTLINPTVLVEVLSTSTEAYDRGTKAQQYRDLESLAHYVLVASEKRHIEVHTRQANGQWAISESSDLAGEVELPVIGCRLALAEVYAKVVFEQKEGTGAVESPQPS